ncbi:MAG: alpha/beta hydrolase [Betaproteobacteria bacterium]
MTPRNLERLTVDGAAGPIETLIAVPERAARGISLVCHPHPLQGGTLDNKVVQTLAKAFFALGYVAARFNFRGVGASAGTFDEGRGETDDALAVLRHLQTRFGASLPLALAGFSFGSFVQTRVAAQVEAEGLVLVGPAVNRFPVQTVPAGTIVVHGEEDDVVPLADVFAWARPQQLPIVVFPGCGHFFHGRLPVLARVVTTMWSGAKIREAA